MRLALTVLLGSLVAATPVAAQLPDLVSPEFQRRTFEPRPEPRAVPTPPTPEVEPMVPAAVQGATFLLRGVELVGVAAVDAAQLMPLWQPLLGTAVDLATLEELAARITASLRGQGFVLSQAVLPPQTIGDDGIVRIQLIEGFVDRLQSEGGSEAGRAIATRLLAPAAAERPLRLETLERGVLLARDTLGGSVETVLQPSPTQFGAADLTVVLEPKPVDGFATIDNRASRLLGPWIARAGIGATNVLGWGERLDAQGAAALGDSRLWYGQAGIAAPLPLLDGTWLDGARLRLSGDVIRTKPDLEEVLVPGFSSVQDEQNAVIELEVPFRRSRESNLFGSLAVGWRDSTAETIFEGGSIGETNDRLIVLAPSLTFDRADRLGGVTLIDVELRRGLGVGGVTRTGAAGPSTPSDDFTAIAGSIQRLQRLGGGGWSIFGEILWQYGFSILPVSERFALGGELLGRGFAPGNTTGDSGYGGRLEVRRLIDVPPIAGREVGVLLYGFGDWGSAIDRSDDRDGAQWEVLGSAGIGARIDVTRYLTLTPEIARQLAGRPVDNADQSRETRFLFGAVARF